MRDGDRKQGLGVRSPRPAPVASHHLLVKAVGVPPSFRHTIIPGQVPTREAREALALVMQEPTPYRPENSLKQDGVYLTPRAVIDNLGLDRARENNWSKFLAETLPQRNEVVVRKALFEKMQGERMDQQLRQAIFQRAMSFRRELSKSLEKGGPFIGPKGGKWSDPAHTIPWQGGESLRWDKTETGYRSNRGHELRRNGKQWELHDPDGSKHDLGTKASFDRAERVIAMRKSEPLRSLSRAEIQQFYVAKSDGMTVEEARDWIDDRWRKLLDRRPDLKSKYPELVLRLQKAEAKGGKYHKRIPKKGGGFHYIYDEGEYQRHPEAHLSGEEVAKGHIRKHVSKAIYEGKDGGCDVNSLADLVKKHGSKLVASVLEEDVTTGGKLTYKGGRLYANECQKPGGG